MVQNVKEQDLLFYKQYSERQRNNGKEIDEKKIEVF